ncbi:hypothetical protein [uncultured Marinobacter sp.]|uniref:3D domain-containing protein n=1 Tax=uncultured Marinobacter sp. TaxID=187379 RepID=UPI002639C0DA|nr:hypothetical protein [uncultured Marinobacter sp.]
MRTLLIALVAATTLTACTGGNTKEVTATAYNSVNSQTKAGDPTLTAWGDTLKPGMKAIAVSRDLIEDGLTHGTEVTIDGLPGTYIVRDKMNKRWKDKIDIYMGVDVKAAREWGKRTVTISWEGNE